MRSIVKAALIFGVLAAAPSPAYAQQDVDILIRGGTVVDGTGSAPRRADVGIRGDRVTFVGDATSARVSGARVIDASGLIVAPGFVDPHTHSAGDLSNPERKANLNYLMQGVTTVINNNDGGGPVDIGQQLAEWTKNGIGTNTAVYIGQGSVRRAVMGMSGEAPTPGQLDSMKKLVARAMDDGAIGLSTGLFYAPGSYSSTEEVIELAKVAAAKGGRYDSHIRDESSYSIGLIGAVAEVIRIGRETRMPVHISHIKALGVDVWGQSDTVIALMKRARTEGIDITASQYPYTASGSSVSASLLPRWAEISGRDSLVARINDPPTRQRLVVEMTENLRRRGGANSLLITGGRDSTIRGKRLDEVARMWRVTPVEAAITIILNGGASVASFNMNEKDIVNFMTQDFISMDSDGSGGHPRLYGAFPKFFHEYVGQKKLMSLAKAVQRSSSASARMLGLEQRGVLAPGYFADVIAFDLATFQDRATYEEPRQLAVGMKYVIVNGVITIDNATHTGVTAGRVLKPASRQAEPAAWRLGGTPLTPDARQQLDIAIDVVRTNSLWRDTVTWPAVERDVRALAAGAQSAADVYPAIRLLLARLGDHHSFVMPPSRAQANRAAGSQNPRPAIRVERDAIGYVSVPGYSGGDPIASVEYAKAVHDSIAAIITSGRASCRWVVDLRSNPGGNMWPMLAGLHPFLGDAELGAFAAGDMIGARWRATQRFNVRAPTSLAPLESAYVAVLTGPRTASSGEAVAVAFRGRPRTRSFGRPTAGLSTANRGFPLPDGGMILLTVSVFMDRNGNRYGGKIEPDEMIPAVAGDSAAELARAIEWVKAQPPCN